MTGGPPLAGRVAFMAVITPAGTQTVLTVAVNFCVAPGASDTVGGLMLTEVTRSSTVATAVAEKVPLVAVTVTVAGRVAVQPGVVSVPSAAMLPPPTTFNYRFIIATWRRYLL